MEGDSEATLRKSNSCSMTKNISCMHVQSNVHSFSSADRADVFFGATGTDAAPLRLYTCQVRSIHVDSMVGRESV
jgi:hypothetical protein